MGFPVLASCWISLALAYVSIRYHLDSSATQKRLYYITYLFSLQPALEIKEIHLHHG